MVDQASLHLLDWCVIVLFLCFSMGVGLYFAKRAGKNLQSFFLSGRNLPWYIAGFSLIATTFAADTPLWMTSLIRKYGVYYVWQYWAPVIGASLAVVLFSRLWRRMNVLTDIEFVEVRYSGKWAARLRLLIGLTSVFSLPLVIGWVTKAMEIIARESMGLPPEYRVWTTMAVVVVGLITCVFSGLWGVVWTDTILFVVGTVGTILLAVFAVREVGGIDEMVTTLSSMEHWNGRALNILPSIGSSSTQMSVWNAIGYFGIMWWVNATAGSFMAQRLMACKNAKHATGAMLLNSVGYHSIICWPWIIVALCSLILLPNLAGATDDCAYPRMIVLLMPIGLRGLLIAALMAAFISTVSTFFNLGSAYFVNDVYKRFMVRNASNKHYVSIGRVMTVYMAVAGGLISFVTDEIQQLLVIMFVVGAGLYFVQALRWFWWRLNAAGEFAGLLACWIITPLLLFARVFDGPARWLFGITNNFSDDPNLLGARMLFMIIVGTTISVVVSLLTKPTDEKHLEEFLKRVRPFHFFWKPVIRRLGIDYRELETVWRTLMSWLLVAICTYALIFGIGKILLGSPVIGLICIVVFIITLWLTIRRLQQDFQLEQPEQFTEGKNKP